MMFVLSIAVVAILATIWFWPRGGNNSPPNAK